MTIAAKFSGRGSRCTAPARSWGSGRSFKFHDVTIDARHFAERGHLLADPARRRRNAAATLDGKGGRPFAIGEIPHFHYSFHDGVVVHHEAAEYDAHAREQAVPHVA